MDANENSFEYVSLWIVRHIIKLNWHYHKEEFAPNRADPKLQMLNEQQQNATMKSLAESYGKVIITWNPNDKA